jgi:hypothetical protein
MNWTVNSGWRGERSHVSVPIEGRGVGPDRGGRSLELPVADPAAVQTRSPEVSMHDR